MTCGGLAARAGVADDSKRRLDKLVLRLGRTVMSGGLFRACVEQNFAEDPSGSVASIQDNPGLLQELEERIESRVEFILRVVGSDMELNESQEVVGVFALYCLYRLISPRALQPNKELFAKLWRAQEKIPVVVLFGKVFWTPDEFLTKFAPIRGLDVRRLQPRVRVLCLPRLRMWSECCPCAGFFCQS